MGGPASAVPAPPAAIVIFGASGDLAARKLLPALHALAEDELLHPTTWVIGVARTGIYTTAIVVEAEGDAKPDRAVGGALLPGLV